MTESIERLEEESYPPARNSLANKEAKAWLPITVWFTARDQGKLAQTAFHGLSLKLICQKLRRNYSCQRLKPGRHFRLSTSRQQPRRFVPPKTRGTHANPRGFPLATAYR